VETLLLLAILIVGSRLEAGGHAKRPVATKLRDGALALGAGGGITLALLVVVATPFDLTLSEYFASQSVPRAHGHNLVNTILVDFRALDTLGEISVVATAALATLAALFSFRRAAPP
jgi:multicomponent Na+:H+ antiporter subunit A